MAAATGAMSKREKTEFEAAATSQDYPEPDRYAEPVSAGTEPSENSESRHFNAWLDRALPMLQERLADLGIFSVTAPVDKSKH